MLLQITLENPLAGIMYGPVIEPPHNGALFSTYSDELLRQGGFHKVPILTGVNSNEGAAVREIPGSLKIFIAFCEYVKCIKYKQHKSNRGKTNRNGFNID